MMTPGVVTFVSAAVLSVVLLWTNDTLLGPEQWGACLGLFLAISIATDLGRSTRLAPRWTNAVIGGLLLVVCLVTAESFLAAHWKTGVGYYFSIGALVPFSDAGGYVTAARRVLEFGRMDAWAARRPLPMALFALLLWLSGGNLRLALVLLALLIALAVFVAVAEVWHRWGALPAIVFLAVMLSGMHISIGLFMTEGWGFLLATLALPLLMRGFARRSPRLLIVGGFLWSLACAARPGALFAPVLVALYAAWELRSGTHLRSASHIRWWLKVPLALGVMAAAFVLSGLTCALIVARSGVSFGSFYYTLYGLARGGGGWDAVLQDHPELAGLSTVALDVAVRRLAPALVAQQPLTLLSTIAASLWHTVKNLFDYVCNLGSPVPYQIMAIPFWLGIGKLIYSWRGEPANRFLLPVIGGIVLSTPFIPDGGPRVLVATTPMVALLCALGVSVFTRGLRSIEAPENAAGGWPRIALSTRFLLAVNVTASTVCILGPPILALRGALVRPRENEHPGDARVLPMVAADERLMEVRLARGSGIVIEEAGAPSLFDLGDLHVSRTNLATAPGLIEMGFMPPEHGYLTSAVDRLRDDSAEYVYLFFPEQPTVGGDRVQIAAKAIAGAPFGHNIYSARVLTPGARF